MWCESAYPSSLAGVLIRSGFYIGKTRLLVLPGVAHTIEFYWCFLDAG